MGWDGWHSEINLRLFVHLFTCMLKTLHSCAHTFWPADLVMDWWYWNCGSKALVLIQLADLEKNGLDGRLFRYAQRRGALAHSYTKSTIPRSQKLQLFTCSPDSNNTCRNWEQTHDRWGQVWVNIGSRSFYPLKDRGYLQMWKSEDSDGNWDGDRDGDRHAR
jgi:hypothetical protein